MPVANQSENQQESGDQQQAHSFRGIDRMALVRMRLAFVRIVFAWISLVLGTCRSVSQGRHAGIVALRIAPERIRPRFDMSRVLHYGVVDACSAQ
jgi:hypothetical protein